MLQRVAGQRDRLARRPAARPTGSPPAAPIAGARRRPRPTPAAPAPPSASAGSAATTSRAGAAPYSSGRSPGLHEPRRPRRRVGDLGVPDARRRPTGPASVPGRARSAAPPSGVAVDQHARHDPRHDLDVGVPVLGVAGAGREHGRRCGPAGRRTPRWRGRSARRRRRSAGCRGRPRRCARGRPRGARQALTRRSSRSILKLGGSPARAACQQLGSTGDQARIRRPGREGYPALPGGFRFGTSTAAYQIEGAVTEDGRGPSVWDTFTAEPGRVVDGTTGAVTCDHYHRVDEDVELMARLGVEGYRFSIAWPRIQPKGTGRPTPRPASRSTTGSSTGCSRPAIQPMVTLYHWDLPAGARGRRRLAQPGHHRPLPGVRRDRRRRPRPTGSSTGSRSTSPTS